MTWEPELLTWMRVQAESLSDFQATRIRLGNRLGAAQETYGESVVPKERLPNGSANPDYLTFVSGPEKAEREMYSRLVVNYKLVAPLDVLEWQESTAGLGPEMIARLIGLIGNPRIATPMHMDPVKRGRKSGRRMPIPDFTNPDGTPGSYKRTLRQLWALCGVGDPERRIKAGMTQDELLACGRRQVRAVLFNIANSIVRTKGSRNGIISPYTSLYESVKKSYDMKLHTAECVRCGTPGRPAHPGSAWKDAHKDASAKRILAKKVLHDLWQLA